MKKQIPYFPLYATDFKAYKDKLTSDELIAVLDAISDLCVFGFTDFSPKNEFQKMFFEVQEIHVSKAKKAYSAKIKNGMKGGRPKGTTNNSETNNKPIGYDSVNQNETETEPTGKQTRTRTRTISKPISKPISKLPKSEKIQDFLDSYNLLAESCNLSEVKKLTDARKKRIKVFLQKYTEDEIKEVFVKVQNSAFLKGENDRGWKCNIDFILKDEKFVGILEGKYSTTKNSADNNAVDPVTGETITQMYERVQKEFDEAKLKEANNE